MEQVYNPNSGASHRCTSPRVSKGDTLNIEHVLPCLPGHGPFEISHSFCMFVMSDSFVCFVHFVVRLYKKTTNHTNPHEKRTQNRKGLKSRGELRMLRG